MDRGPRWRTRANGITLLRLGLAPLLAWAVVEGAAAAAAAILVLAVASDLLDGRVARRYGEASPLGGFADHAADATFVVAGTLALAICQVVPAALPVLIAAAFAQYTVDSRVLDGQSLRASPLGRWNGIAYYGVVAVPVVRDALGQGWPPDGWILAAGWALVATTLVSMADRLRRLPHAGASGPE